MQYRRNTLQHNKNHVMQLISHSVVKSWNHLLKPRSRHGWPAPLLPLTPCSKFSSEKLVKEKKKTIGNTKGTIGQDRPMHSGLTDFF